MLPLQAELAPVKAAVGAAKVLMTVVAEAVQPLALVTVTVKVPVPTFILAVF